MMDTPGRRSIDHPEAPSTDPKGLSSLPLKLPAFEGLSLDELRHEWRRLYRSDRQQFNTTTSMGRVRALQAELDAAGIKSKRRTLADGTAYGGQKLSRGALYLMLQNRIYRGEISHKGNAYPGEHPPIIDQALWDQVQAVLAENRVNREVGSNAKQPSLLAGLVFDETGERLTPSHSVKKGTRYRYYVSRSLIIGTAGDKSKGRRIPAGNLENLVISKLRASLADQGTILDAIRDGRADGAGQNRLIARGRQIAEELVTMAPD